MEERGANDKKADRLRANWGDGRIAFFALLPEIAGELARKVPMSRIYARHKGRLGISYRQFIRLVREFRDEAGDKNAAAASSAALGAPSASPRQEREVRKPLYSGPPEERTFHFDPMDAYRKKWD